jgi:hypothetical protein
MSRGVFTHMPSSDFGCWLSPQIGLGFFCFFFFLGGGTVLGFEVKLPTI